MTNKYESDKSSQVVHFLSEEQKPANKLERDAINAIKVNQKASFEATNNGKIVSHYEGGIPMVVYKN